MAENIEFIAAKDLPVSEAEEVEVLCLENGELKRKAAKGLSGGGGCVIDLVESTELNFDAQQSVITTVNYDTFAQKWWDGCPIIVKCKFGGMPATMHPFGIVYAEGTGIMMAVPNMLGGATIMVVFANGTWTPPVE